MVSLKAVEIVIETYRNLNMLLPAIEFLLKNYELESRGLDAIIVKEKARPSFLVLTTVGKIKEKQTINIPENLLDFPLVLVINLLAHEMLHVKQKSSEIIIENKNEREWQAYYEMLFHLEYPLVPTLSNFYIKEFGLKALEYYNRMGENSELQLKYIKQKKMVEELIYSL